VRADFEAFLKTIPGGRFEPQGGPIPFDRIRVPAECPGDILPDSYRVFVATIGSVYWLNESGEVMAPSEIYSFDADCWEMEGFVPLVQNAAGVGDYIAVNPKDPVDAGERPVYYCGHDPVSWVRAADSFEDWVRQSVAAEARDGSDRYEYLDAARSVSYRRYQADRSDRGGGARKWWQFWK
jgi:SMI1/KNR4 family protein SUKH-1